MPSSPSVFRLRPAVPSDRDRGTARERGYTASWDRASAAYGRDHPLCEYCLVGAFGEVRDEPRACTDHLYPQRRFRGIFWRDEWWVSCCDDCHKGGKAQAEHEGLDALHRLADLLGRPRLQPEGGGVGQIL